MGKASSIKGAQGERDIARRLALLLGIPGLVRKLGAGRREDTGDLHGIPGFTVQVAARANLGDTLRYKPLDCMVQQHHGGTPYGVTMMKLPPQPGGKPQAWRAVFTLEQFADVYETLRKAHGWPCADFGEARAASIALEAGKATEALTG